MITAADVENLYKLSPFGGDPESGDIEERVEADIQNLNDVGLDIEDIIQWAASYVAPASEKFAQMGATPAQLGFTVFLSALRVGFYLGRSYTEDESNEA